ncbi:MAG: hypothetical protein F8N37_04640 [Telmatospirillum sp.]|nr:hypothetical protein [Telmatospirillum sp.]
MKVLGLSAFYHDSAAALVVDGDIVAAAHEERFTRKKHDPAFPGHAIRACLAIGGLGLRDLDAVVYYEKPGIKFGRLLATHASLAPRGYSSFEAAMRVWLGGKLFLRRELTAALAAIDDRFRPDRLKFSDHHMSHAASAFYPSPFERAVILTCDGVGEWTTTSLGLGEGHRIRMDRVLHFPHSLGLLYSAFTAYCGFRVNSGEYKLMGLAPYGTPRYAADIRRHLIDVAGDGSFRLNPRFFDYCVGRSMTTRAFDDLWGRPPLEPGGVPDEVILDLAASIQQVTEEVLALIVADAMRTYGRLPLVMAGGVALNCVANGRLLSDGLVDRIWIQPAAGDAGGALGAALAYAADRGGPVRPAAGTDSMKGCALGPSYSDAEIEAALVQPGLSVEVMSGEDALTRAAAADLAEGKAVGWHQGRSEFGPRALGGRSILADPRSATMQTDLNLKIKFRESFRPFAPSVLAEDCADWFELSHPSPYMLLVAAVRDSRRLTPSAEDAALRGLDRRRVRRSLIPAVTHVDNSARVQTIHRETSPLYHALVSRFRDLTGCPLVVNTSFNVRGEPIVETPGDALRCFLGTRIDRLYVGRYRLAKENQPDHLKVSYVDQVEKD